MENLQESKTITIDDLGNKISFKICLFGAIEGLDFLEKILNIIRKTEKNEPLSIKPFLNDLLKLACPINNNNEPMFPNKTFNVEIAGTIFRNPLSILELGNEVFKFQEVFIQNSKAFQPLTDKVKNLFPTENLG